MVLGVRLGVNVHIKAPLAKYRRLDQSLDHIVPGICDNKVVSCPPTSGIVCLDKLGNNAVRGDKRSR